MHRGEHNLKSECRQNNLESRRDAGSDGEADDERGATYFKIGIAYRGATFKEQTNYKTKMKRR